MKLLIGIACALLATSLASVASAEEEGPPRAALTESATPDTIHLRSGGVVVGRVTEIVGGEHVTIVTPSGETRNVPWSDVARLVVVSTVFPPRPPAPSRGPAPMVPDSGGAGPEPMVGPLVFVHIDASGPAHLYRRAAGTDDYVTVCEAPCDKELPVGDSYKLGTGSSTTPAFKLEPQAGGVVRLEVSRSSWLGIVGGSLLATLGLVLWGSMGDKASGATNVGLFFAGGAAITGGIFAIVASGKTRISQTKLEREERREPQRDAFVRAPVWRSARSEQVGAATATFPLLLERRF